MSKGFKRGQQHIPNQNKSSATSLKSKSGIDPRPETASLLEVMIDGREYESLLQYQIVNLDSSEIQKALKEMQDATGVYTIALLGNIINTKVKGDISINSLDDLPFAEMINIIPADIKQIDIVIATPGGSGEQVNKFVDKLRPRFDKVRFIIPDAAMSAGTIFAMSGDEIIMTENSYIGPIDPQVPNKDGIFVPAQSILALIDEIKDKGNKALSRGQQPDWTDLQILHKMDTKDIGAAVMASRYSIELVQTYLEKYKLKNWTKHTSTGQDVTDAERKAAADKIATILCDHKIWKSHGRGITRAVALNECGLKITHAESIAGLNRAIKRFWAVAYWFFENSTIFKAYLSPNYVVFRTDPILPNN